ncbi:hypothetical protein B9Z19DRAFT_1128486 [Tuber borchii]|uniref:Uncharacterized protein n=1 Tax=Tuber borchii TaxID=42251 RepID=A0A2T6ZPA4_TUBBO|nr:hypothetical protein B9Z19DRAFT_1128486 [Tuber borchii]
MQGLVLSRGLRGTLRTRRITTLGYTRKWSSSDAIAGGGPLGIFDAIIVARSPVRTLGSLIPDAIQVIKQAANVDELKIKKVKEETIVGNSRGLDLANLAMEIAELKDQIASNKAETDLVSRDQEAWIKYLLFHHSRYELIRGRFLVSFGRKKDRVSIKEDRKLVEQGNLVAHWGDAVFDATLYPHKVTDTEIFRMLYGVLPKEMQRIKNHNTIYALNTHAGVLGSDSKEGSPRFTDLFNHFIQVFKESDFDESYTEGAEVTCACDNFIDSAETEVKRIRPSRRS